MKTVALQSQELPYRRCRSCNSARSLTAERSLEWNHYIINCGNCGQQRVLHEEQVEDQMIPLPAQRPTAPSSLEGSEISMEGSQNHFPFYENEDGSYEVHLNGYKVISLSNWRLIKEEFEELKKLERKNDRWKQALESFAKSEEQSDETN